LRRDSPSRQGVGQLPQTPLIKRVLPTNLDFIRPPADGRSAPPQRRRFATTDVSSLSTEGIKMGLKGSIQAAAKAAVLTDAADLQGLVSLSELLRQLASDATAEGSPEIAVRSNEAAELSDLIILRQVNDVDAAFRRVVEAIGACETASERADAPRREPPDPELLVAWIASCESTIPDIEHLAVKAESQGFVGETAAEIRRRIHTLKGECGVLSLSEAQSVCHDLESLIDGAGQKFPVDAVLGVCDWMRALTLRLGQDAAADEPDTSAVRQILLAHLPPAVVAPIAPTAAPAAAATAAAPTTDPLTDPFAGLSSIPEDQRVTMNLENADENVGDFALEAREHLANAENAVLSLEANPTDDELVNVVFRAFHTIKGVAGFLNLPRIVEVAHAAEFLLDKVRSHKIPLSAHVLELVLASSDLLGQLIGMLSGGEAPKERELRILVRRLEAACEGRALAAPGAPAVRPMAKLQSDEAPTTDALASAPIAATKQTPTKTIATAKADQSVKVSTQRMDALVNLVGELVIAQLMVVQDPEVSTLHGQRVQRNLSHLGKIVRDLQETSMSLRMVTLKSTFQKMARLVRDVAAKAGKHIQLEVEGEDVELDRNVVEEIGDPLVHMIRNACDHGIEPSDERRKAGKNEIGTLRLRACHSGGSIVIEVEDDGRGLSRERILKKCLEKGLIEPTRNINEIPDSEVFNYVFLPGFSTAEKVTDISGRGVGMDVVRRNIEALRGSVEIHSTTGKGSVFSMRLPLTMAIIDGMVVRVGQQRYIVPTLNIERSFRPTQEQLTMVLGKGELVRVRTGLLPIYRLQRIFNLNEGCEEITDGLLLILEIGKRRACVFVDEILGQQQVVIKNLGDTQPQIRGVSGGAILGDGLVALIVDVGGLLETAAGSTTQTQLI
jgi:two-component system chemotaxis sensor kinase CheA